MGALCQINDPLLLEQFFTRFQRIVHCVSNQNVEISRCNREFRRNLHLHPEVSTYNTSNLVMFIIKHVIPHIYDLCCRLQYAFKLFKGNCI